MPDGVGRCHGEVSGHPFLWDRPGGNWGAALGTIRKAVHRNGASLENDSDQPLVIIVGIVLIGLPMVRNFDIAWEQILKEARPYHLGSDGLGWEAIFFTILETSM